MKTNKDLGERIEKLVHDLVETHMQETRAAVLAAVARGFETPQLAATQPRAAKSKSRPFNGRRSGGQIAALAERLFELVCAKPGDSMVTFATELGVTSQQLDRPMKMLKNAGRVRSVGERNRTCYFPAVGSKSTSSPAA